ncbi:MAG: DUF814 domain-containing protein [Planctomycetes bacterium]|nr:DUF814 domain-containing protein [Planctomycetota bacterium]
MSAKDIGLTAEELALALGELGARVGGWRVRDVARLARNDDLLLFLEGPPPAEGRAPRACVQVAVGGGRARVTLTARRHAKDEFATGPHVDRLRQLLAEATFRGTSQPAGERRCSLAFADRDGRRVTLEAELFGNRGLWVLCDGQGRALELSRLPEARERTLAPGQPYDPPRGRARGEARPPRFAPPVLEAIDALCTAHDREHEARARRDQLAATLAGAEKRLVHKVEGLQRQLDSIGEAPELRRRADLLLAYRHLVRRGAAEVEVPDPEHADRTLRIDLDPAKPVQATIEALYDRARRLEDAAGIAAERRIAAAAELADVRALRLRLDEAGDDPAVEAVEAAAAAAGLVRAPRPAAGTARPATTRAAPREPGVRRFVSAEGYEILCGKSNADNDRLSLKIARGNDLWFHVGAGHAGSHVVVRLPKGKTASLETMLDAGTIAVHFSKARGAGKCEVVYAPAKHVRKPKGLPPGKVLVAHEGSLMVRLEEDRLRRLLASQPAPESD